jgi:RNA polymerase sigma-70 factor (ECF subfamily)
MPGLEVNVAIEALLTELPPDQAEVVLLRVVADLSVEHVAGIMGRSPGSVRVLQHRPLRRLQKNLDPAVTK